MVLTINFTDPRIQELDRRVFKVVAQLLSPFGSASDLLKPYPPSRPKVALTPMPGQRPRKVDLKLCLELEKILPS
jgi:hypothetical protein